MRSKKNWQQLNVFNTSAVVDEVMIVLVPEVFEGSKNLMVMMSVDLFLDIYRYGACIDLTMERTALINQVFRLVNLLFVSPLFEHIWG